MEIKKNRDRDKYTFANINLLGRCNADCYFCLGKDIAERLLKHNQLATHFSEWKNFSVFLDMCRSESVSNLFMTGQTADGLQYRYLDELVAFLQGHGFVVGLRSNGYLAEQKLDTINRMNGEIGYSIHSLNTETNRLIMGKETIPNWEFIIPKSGDNVRVSIVVNRYNINELDGLINYIAAFENVKYIQLRRISTDTRLAELERDIALFEQFFSDFKKRYNQVGEFCTAEEYELYGKRICFWRTVETRCNSLNYFTDGTCSDEYFVVEGYCRYSNNYPNQK